MQVLPTTYTDFSFAHIASPSTRTQNPLRYHAFSQSNRKLDVRTTQSSMPSRERTSRSRTPRRKPLDHPPSYNSTTTFGKKIIQVAKNKHVPISNIFITLPKSIQTSTSKMESFYSCNPDQGLVLIQRRLSIPSPRIHHSQETPMAKTKKGRKNSVG